MLPDAADRDVKILASDIDPNVVAEGREGVYEDTEIASVPPAERSRSTSSAAPSSSGKRSEVNDELRRLVTFRELNLIGHWPMKGPFDVIFCRNVVIYFDEDTQAKIWSRFAPLLDAARAALHRSFGAPERPGSAALRQRRHHDLSTHRRTGVRRSRVLVVDDSASMRQLIASVLNAAPDIEVVGQAADPLEAREAIKALNPDVVTLDVEMPNMNGLDFPREADAAAPDTRDHGVEPYAARRRHHRQGVADRRDRLHHQACAGRPGTVRRPLRQGSAGGRAAQPAEPLARSQR